MDGVVTPSKISDLVPSMLIKIMIHTYIIHHHWYVKKIQIVRNYIENIFRLKTSNKTDLVLNFCYVIIKSRFFFYLCSFNTFLYLFVFLRFERFIRNL